MGRKHKVKAIMVGNAGMQSLIPVVNKIQDLCTQMGTGLQFDLPQIAVVGSQSTGKSSVLEGFVGRDFLPRGKDIVTRCPLVLQLINTPADSQEYGEFLHCQDRKFENFDDIRAEIENQTERQAVGRKCISNVPINLRIYSPNVLNLTLVDLPGVVKNPVGDQPLDIETQIRNMILEYIRKENCLILAVSAANVDLATSDALKLANEVDPKGIRTIGVVTKLDLMDEGTDAQDILENKAIPLRHGYIGVVNRSQKSIEDKKDIAKALEDERNFFQQHSYYRTRNDRLGIPYLQKMLNKTLTKHIKDKLPALKESLRKQEVTLKRELSEYEELHPVDAETKKSRTVEVVRKFQSDWKLELGSLDSNIINTKRLSSGAKIRRIFQKRLPNDIAKIQLNKPQSQREIKIAIENLYGIDSMVYAPFKAFETIVREQILLLKDPVLACVELVIEELSKAVRTVLTGRMDEYPAFRDTIESLIIEFIHSNKERCTKSILELIDMQSDYVNAKYNEFAENGESEDKATEPTSNDENDDEKFDPDASTDMDSEAEEIEDDVGPADKDICCVFDKVAAYMQTAQDTTVHMVPKAIMHHIVRKMEKFINTELLVQILKDVDTNETDLLAADQDDIDKYKENHKMHAICKKALEVITNMRIGSAANSKN